MAKSSIKTFRRYPASGLLIYNGATLLHFSLGGLGIYLGYDYLGVGIIFALLYVVFAFLEMYVVMPLKVCPNCVYYRMEDSLCVSGLNVVSKRIAKEGNLKDFQKRAIGPLSHNRMYMASLIVPMVAIVPALILNFSVQLLLILLVVFVLLLFRFFVIFKKVACIYCSAKHICPNAKAMGLQNT